MASTPTVSSIVNDAISPLIYTTGTGSPTLTVGAVVGVFINRVSHFFPFGLSSIGGDAPDETTLFQIGSVTKVFTTSLLGALPFQNGTEPTSFYNSSIAKQVPTAYKLQKWEQEITFEELATFTAGINPSAPKEPCTQAQFVTFIDGRVKPPSRPAAYEYSDSSIGFLGQILISMTGSSDYGSATAADAWYAANLFDPLSMSSSGHTSPQGAQVAKFYAVDTDGNYQQVDQAPWVPWGTAGRTLSNVNDMLNFVMANLQVTTIAGKSVPTSLTQGMAQALLPWPRKGEQGFAWAIYDLQGHTINVKNGGLPGCAAVVELCSALNYGVVALANCGSIPAGATHNAMTGALEKATKCIMEHLMPLA